MQRHYIGAQCIISWVTYVNFPMIIAHRRFIDATERNCTIFFDTGYLFSEWLIFPSGFSYDLQEFAQILQKNVSVEQFFVESVQILVNHRKISMEK